MGGRGTKLNLEEYLGRSSKERINEYDAIFINGNIKFLMQKDGKRTTAPIFSNTAGRIYVTIKPDGTIAGITKYDSNHRQAFSINEPHETDKIKQVHIHSSLETGRQITYWDHMSENHKKLYKSIKEMYKKYDIATLVKEYNKLNGR